MKTVSQNLLDYLQSNPGVHASGDLQRLEWYNSDNHLVTAQTVGRELRRLAELGKIHVDYKNNHAHYSFTEIPKPKKLVPQQFIKDGQIMVRMVEV